MGKNIVMITTMYPDQIRPVTKVCHYYTREWVKMGHQVTVFTMRSMFPSVYTTVAGMFPGLAKRYIGNHVEMDRNMNTVELELDRVKIYSMPIYKYFPHGNYPQRSIKRALGEMEDILRKNGFTPDAIVGHFHNPTAELIYELSKVYPEVKTSVTFHITPNYVLCNYTEKRGRQLFGSFTTLGFRHKTLREQYEEVYGPFKNTFVCYSGTSDAFLEKPVAEAGKNFDAQKMTKFLYVGQFTHNKSIRETIEALHHCYPSGGYHIDCIGDGGTAYQSIIDYVVDNDLEKYVEFPGRMDRESIIRYYDQAQVFVMISKQEAFGLVYLEAMARGCICVGTRGQGIDGVIEDGKNGFLCEGGNAKELGTIIQKINEMTVEERRAMSRKARETAERLSERNVAEMYIASVFNANSEQREEDKKKMSNTNKGKNE